MPTVKTMILFLLLPLFGLVNADKTVTKNTEATPVADSIWLPIVEKLADPKLDGFALPISNVTLNHVDFSLVLDSGTLFLFEPVMLRGKPTYYGGYFIGEGRFDFKPGLKTERYMVKRFYKSDSVTNKFNHVVLFFPDSGFIDVNKENLISDNHPLKDDRQTLDYCFRSMTRYSDYNNAMTLLKNLLHPRSDPFLIVHVINDRFDHDEYSYNPLAREEVKLGKAYPEWDGVETVCRYHHLVNEDLTNLNGPRKDAINPKSYKIESSIDEKGMFSSDAVIQADILDSSAQFMTFLLNSKMEIESVETADGQLVEFLRERRETLQSLALHILLPEPPAVGSSVTIRIRYHGKIAERMYGLYIVDASIFWYPHPFANRKSTFDLRFKSPKPYTLISSAAFVDSSSIGDTLFTHWRTVKPERSVTFNIAGYETRTVSENGVPDIELYYNKSLHEAVYRKYQKDWDKDLAKSVVNSIKLFSNVYGPPNRDYFRVSEILYSHGESFPGSVNLPFWSFEKENLNGEDLLVRAHEVAHQWWGSSVGYETYHDQWLSEGLATYSALRYGNAVVGSERLEEKLREFREDVFSTGGFFAGGKESGPIIQGYRTQSSKTRGAYRLIIYEKAALVLHMLRCHLTNWNTLDHSKFNDFLGEFYRRHADGYASTQDFRNLLEEQTGVDWGWFFNQWVYGTELPEYTFHKNIRKDDSDGLWHAYCMVEQRNVSPGFTVIMPIEIEFGKDDKQYAAYVIKGDTTEFTLTFNDKPKNIRLNPFEAVLCRVKQ